MAARRAEKAGLAFAIDQKLSSANPWALHKPARRWRLEKARGSSLRH